jgi:hypothetical protein
MPTSDRNGQGRPTPTAPEPLPVLADHHRRMLETDSAISPNVIDRRGYRTARALAELQRLGFARQQGNAPALVIPVYGPAGDIVLIQIRPDEPRVNREGQIARYEVPRGARLSVDVPPAARDLVLRADQRLLICHGIRSGDAVASRGAACLALLNARGWQPTDAIWKLVPFSGRRVRIVLDSAAAMTLKVLKATIDFKHFLEGLGAVVDFAAIPASDGRRQNVDDFLAGGHSLEDVWSLPNCTVPADAPPASTVGMPDTYHRMPNGICIEVTDKTGEVVLKPLTNFDAKITAQNQLSDGVDVLHELEITATVGAKTTMISVPADRFEKMEWVIDELGAEAIVYSGFNTRDHVRVAIQTLSGAIPTYIVYEHLGWVEHEGQWNYLHADGIIRAASGLTGPAQPATSVLAKSSNEECLSANGPIGPMSATDVEKSGVQVRVPSVLSRYRLPMPSTGDDLRTDVILTMNVFLDVAPREVSLTLLGAVFLAAIDSPDFSIHLVGLTGTGKSVLAALVTQFFGAAFSDRSLSDSWISTANSIMANAFLAKNTVFVVDDLIPTGSRSDIDRAFRDADRLFRSQGNQAGRGRCSRDGKPLAGKAPRCLLLSTGEVAPEGHSLNARLFTIELKKGDVLHGPREPMVTFAQRLAAKGLFARTMAAFLKWAAPQYGQLHNETRDQKLAFREAFVEPGQHPRGADIAAALLAGFEIFLDFAQHVGAIDQTQRDGLWDEIHDALRKLLGKQQETAQEIVPAKRYLRLLASAFATGLAHVKDRANQPPDSDQVIWGWLERYRTITEIGPDGKSTETEIRYFEPRGSHIGWVDDFGLYLDIATSLAAANALAQRSDLRPLGLNETTLGSQLHDQGLLVTESADHYTVRRTILGLPKRVLHLSKTHFFYELAQEDAARKKAQAETIRVLDELLDG